MKPCQFAGPQCPHEAVTTVRIDFVGDRPVCAAHRDFVLTMGMGRELDPSAAVPEWRKNLRAVDLTSRVYAR
jgi:hypothetical protein